MRFEGTTAKFTNGKDIFEDGLGDFTEKPVSKSGSFVDDIESPTLENASKYEALFATQEAQRDSKFSDGKHMAFKKDRSHLTRNEQGQIIEQIQHESFVNAGSACRVGGSKPSTAQANGKGVLGTGGSNGNVPISTANGAGNVSTGTGKSTDAKAIKKRKRADKKSQTRKAAVRTAVSKLKNIGKQNEATGDLMKDGSGGILGGITSLLKDKLALKAKAMLLNTAAAAGSAVMTLVSGLVSILMTLISAMLPILLPIVVIVGLVLALLAPFI